MNLICVYYRDKDDNERFDTDISRLPPAMWAEDPISQAEAYRNLVNIALNRTELKFQDARLTTVKASYLKALFEANDLEQSVKLLKRRRQLVIDREYMHYASDPEICPCITEGALDFSLYVPKVPGFHAIIPNTGSDPNYEWQLNLRKPQKQFNSKHAKVGYDLVRSVLFCGRYRDQETFIVFPPLDFFHNAFEYTPAGFSSGPTNLKYDVYLKALILLAFLLSQNGIAGITLSNKYPSQLKTLRDVEAVTNLL